MSAWVSMDNEGPGEMSTGPRKRRGLPSPDSRKDGEKEKAPVGKHQGRANPKVRKEST